jgi:tetratricopeptide (TPR) repeat protein
MALQREQIVQTAEKFVARGKIEPAIKEYRKLLAENPNDINTLNRVGDLYARIQRIDEAVDFFTQIAEQYSVEGFFVKAIAIYKKIIKLDPTRLEVYEQLAELYHKQGLVTEARTQYQVLADYYQKHDNAASAIAIYQKMAQLEPDNPTYHVKLAEIYHQQQLIEKAMGEYRIIAELMIKHGRPQEAAQVYERALDIDSQSIPFITDAVLKLREAGNNAGAVHFLSVAVERNPQAEKVARMVRFDEPVAAVEAAAAEEVAVEEEAFDLTVEEEEPPPPPPPRRAAPPPPPAASRRPIEIEEEEEIDLSFDDDLSRAMAEAAAAVGGDDDDGIGDGGSRAPAAARGMEEDEEVELELNLDDMFEIDLPDEDEEPTSLVKPPADMDGGPRRPAWAQEAPPAAAAASAADTVTLSPQEPGAGDAEIELELDMSSLDGFVLDTGAFALRDPLPSLPVQAEPELPAESPEAGDSFDVWDSMPFAAERTTTTPAEAPDLPGELELDEDLLETSPGLGMAEPEREEDLVTEAEVLAKYGLEDKAVERLGEALRLRPDHLSAYALLIQIHFDKGRHAVVMDLANHMSGVASGREPWLKVRKRLVDAGYRLDGDKVLAFPGSASPAAAPPAAATVAPPPPMPRRDEWVEMTELPGLPEMLETPETPETPEITEAAPPSPPPVAAAPPPPPADVAPPPPPPAPRPASSKAAKADKVDDLLRGLLGPKKAPRPAAPAPVQPPPPVQAVSAPPPPPPVAAAPPPPPPPPVAKSGPPPSVFNPLQIGALVESLDVDDDGLGTPLNPWADHIVDIPVPQAPPPPPVAFSSAQSAGINHEPLDDTGGMSWLDEPPPQEPTSAAELFDEEDDFFDLAGELVEELSKEEAFQRDGILVQSEQTLEEIVEGFKKGVAEHLSPTDYDTHFNLGIAYREMGLLDEAIGEFQLASKDARYLVLCCSMLGLCFLDKGLGDLAVKWYRRALEFPSISEEDRLGMMYDLGNVYMAMSDWENAHKTFGDLYGIDANYRDVVAKMEELSGAR